MKKILILWATVALASCNVSVNGTDDGNTTPAPTTYIMTLTADGDGTARADKSEYAAGEMGTLSATPKGEYVFSEWKVMSGSVILSNVKDNPASFIMPAKRVEIRAMFVLETGDGDGDPGDGDPGDGTDYTQGVTINGVTWAQCNVDAPGTFTATPGGYGMYYQFNRRVGWSSTNPLVSSPAGAVWDGASYDLTPESTWESANDPCPEGWRMPVIEELESLFGEQVSNKWTYQFDVEGWSFEDQQTGDTIFLPFAGNRLPSGALDLEMGKGNPLYGGTSVGVWITLPFGGEHLYGSCALYLSDNDMSMSVAHVGYHPGGSTMSVRCVKQS